MNTCYKLQIYGKIWSGTVDDPVPGTDSGAVFMAAATALLTASCIAETSSGETALCAVVSELSSLTAPVIFGMAALTASCIVPASWGGTAAVSGLSLLTLDMLTSGCVINVA